MTNHFPKLIASLVSLCLSSHVGAAIIYTDIPDQGVFGSLGDDILEVDLNNDSITDFVFRSNFAPGDGFVILPQSGNLVFSSPIPNPPDINTFARDFDNGQLIGVSILGEGLDLVGQRFDVTGREIGPGLLSCALFSQLICLGEFDTKEAQNGGDPTDFVGVVLNLDGKSHLGYVEILSSGFNGGTVVGFAYETEPDKAILAGSIPEPSSVLLTLLGVPVLFRRRR